METAHLAWKWLVAASPVAAGLDTASAVGCAPSPATLVLGRVRSLREAERGAGRRRQEGASALGVKDAQIS